MYILCCGYPPFYSSGGKRLSPGMEKRIKRGEYEFPEAEWSLISSEGNLFAKFKYFYVILDN